MGNPAVKVGSTEKGSAFEVPPPGVGFITCRRITPPLARSPAFSVVVKVEAFARAVTRGAPFTSTTESGTSPVPVTVTVVETAEAIAAALGESLEIDGTGL